jgi:release factor glutamine methyltransferase
METPYTNHITEADFENIYEPAEDSFLLLDALEDDLQSIQSQMPLICLEIGPGSGVIVTALSKALQNRGAFCMAIDINPYACKITKQTATVNAAAVDTINMNLLTNFQENSIDILIFNPPYVVTSSSAAQTKNLNNLEMYSEELTSTCTKNLIRTWAGGENGREVIDPLLYNLDKILTQTGVFYLLIEKRNNLSEIEDILKLKQFTVEVFKERKIRGEHLFVLKIFRKKN